MLEKVMPSVVSINVEGSQPLIRRVCRVISSSSSVMILVLPGRFSVPELSVLPGGPGRNGGGQQQKFMALGSGVIIDPIKAMLSPTTTLLITRR